MKALITYLNTKFKYDYKYFLKYYSYSVTFIGVIFCALLMILDELLNTGTTLVSIFIGLILCVIIISDSIING